MHLHKHMAATCGRQPLKRTKCFIFDPPTYSSSQQEAKQTFHKIQSIPSNVQTGCV